jgi:hypothetical protein
MDMTGGFIEGGQSGVFKKATDFLIPAVHTGFFHYRQCFGMNLRQPGGVHQRLRGGDGGRFLVLTGFGHYSSAFVASIDVK